MNPLHREAAVGATLTLTAGVLAFALVDPAFGVELLLLTGLVCAVAALWRETHRLRRAQATRTNRIGKRISALEHRTSGLREEQDAHAEQLMKHLDQLGHRLVAEMALQFGEADRRTAEDADRRLRELLDTTVGRIDAGEDRVLESIESSARRSEKVFRHRGREENRVLYAKVDDLMGLYRDIDPVRSLPALHGWAIGPDLARLLYREVVDRKRTRILECGSGSTTVILAYALRELGSGRVTSLEHDPDYAEQTRRAVAEHGLAAWVSVIDAPLAETVVDGTSWQWYDTSIVPAGTIDLLLVDGPPGPTGPLARYPAMPVLGDRLADDAVVILDDAFREDEQEIGRRWRSAFPEFTSRTVQNDYGALVLRRSPAPEAG
jgi:predicted O-methyltransferase YrrM